VKRVFNQIEGACSSLKVRHCAYLEGEGAQHVRHLDVVAQQLWIGVYRSHDPMSDARIGQDEQNLAVSIGDVRVPLPHDDTPWGWRSENPRSISRGGLSN
jgi:hypothetical protein